MKRSDKKKLKRCSESVQKKRDKLLYDTVMNHADDLGENGFRAKRREFLKQQEELDTLGVATGCFSRNSRYENLDDSELLIITPNQLYEHLGLDIREELMLESIENAERMRDESVEFRVQKEMGTFDHEAFEKWLMQYSIDPPDFDLDHVHVPTWDEAETAMDEPHLFNFTYLKERLREQTLGSYNGGDILLPVNGVPESRCRISICIEIGKKAFRLQHEEFDIYQIPNRVGGFMNGLRVRDQVKVFQRLISEGKITLEDLEKIGIDMDVYKKLVVNQLKGQEIFECGVKVLEYLRDDFRSHTHYGSKDYEYEDFDDKSPEDEEDKIIKVSEKRKKS